MGSVEPVPLDHASRPPRADPRPLPTRVLVPAFLVTSKAGERGRTLDKT